MKNSMLDYYCEECKDRPITSININGVKEGVCELCGEHAIFGYLAKNICLVCCEKLNICPECRNKL